MATPLPPVCIGTNIGAISKLISLSCVDLVLLGNVVANELPSSQLFCDSARRRAVLSAEYGFTSCGSAVLLGHRVLGKHKWLFFPSFVRWKTSLPIGLARLPPAQEPHAQHPLSKRRVYFSPSRIHIAIGVPIVWCSGNFFFSLLSFQLTTNGSFDAGVELPTKHNKGCN